MTLLKILLFFAFAAYGQQERIAIINTMDDRDSIGFSELSYLTDKLRETAVNVLPKQLYGIMTTESIVAFLGSQERAVKVCKEATCLAQLGRLVNADYVAQAHIGRFGDNLTIKTELYDSKKGNLIGSFTSSSKDIYGLLAVIDEKASDLFKKMPSDPEGTKVASVAGGINVLERSAGYELAGEKRYIVNLSTEPPGAALSFDGVPNSRCIKTPCKAELRGGSVRIIANLEQYEIADTTISVFGNNQSIAIALKPNVGILKIKPAYSENISNGKGWFFTINGKTQSYYVSKLASGNYDVKLSHECYEDISFKVGINSGSHEVFDMAGHITLKKGGLDLSAELNGEPVMESVFVNGKYVGETPFSGAVPLCAKIELGKNRQNVEVKLKHNEKVSFTAKINGIMNKKAVGTALDNYHFDAPKPEKRDKTSLWIALALDVFGAAFIYAGYEKHEEMWNAHEKYVKIKNSGGNYKDAWEDVNSNRSSRDMFYAVGGVFLASGIVVHIWF